MDDLAVWLRVQLDEDERIARTLNPDPVASMSRKFEADALRVREELKAGKSDRVPYDEGQADALHWAATVLPERMPVLSPFGQGRVLREVEAKRRLLVSYSEVAANDVNEVEYAHGYANALGEAVRLLALPYADRLGYREEWRP